MELIGEAPDDFFGALASKALSHLLNFFSAKFGHDLRPFGKDGAEFVAPTATATVEPEPAIPAPLHVNEKLLAVEINDPKLGGATVPLSMLRRRGVVRIDALNKPAIDTSSAGSGEAPTEVDLGGNLDQLRSGRKIRVKTRKVAIAPREVVAKE